MKAYENEEDVSACMAKVNPNLNQLYLQTRTWYSVGINTVMSLTVVLMLVMA